MSVNQRKPRSFLTSYIKRNKAQAHSIIDQRDPKTVNLFFRTMIITGVSLSVFPMLFGDATIAPTAASGRPNKKPVRTTVNHSRPRNDSCLLSLPASPLLRCQAQSANEASGCELLWAWAPTKQSHKPSVGLATDDYDTSLRSSRVGASLNPEALCSTVGRPQEEPQLHTHRLAAHNMGAAWIR